MFRIAGIIVVYFPDYVRLESLVIRLQGQVSVVYIVNNGLVDEPYRKFVDLMRSAGVEFISMSGNAGVASALNRGISEAQKNHIDACWTFDQDSIPGPEDGSKLSETLQRARRENLKVAAIAPTVVNLHRQNRVLPFLVFDTEGAIREDYIHFERTVGAAITSGMLICTQAWLESGGMRDDYFIDLVDTEWCFRTRWLGYRIICNPQARVDHCLGEGSLGAGNRFAGLLRQRSAFRTFHMIRNALMLGKEAYAPPNWYAYVTPKLIRTSFLALIAGPDRIGQVKAIFTGIKMGLKAKPKSG